MALTVIVTVDVLPSAVPSLALNVKVSVPLKFADGVYDTMSPDKEVVPFDELFTIE
jgi:hypothetical protein